MLSLWFYTAFWWSFDKDNGFGALNYLLLRAPAHNAGCNLIPKFIDSVVYYVRRASDPDLNLDPVKNLIWIQFQ